MPFIAPVTFKQTPTAGSVEEVEDDRKAGIRYRGIYRTPGGYGNVVLFETPDEKAAITMALKRAGRTEVRTLTAVPGDPSSPSGPA